LERFFEEARMQTEASEEPAAETHAVYLVLAERLGQRTAELHQAFAAENEDPAFRPEPIQLADITAWKTQIHTDAETTFRQLAKSLGALETDLQMLVKEFLDHEPNVLALTGRFDLEDGDLQKTRYHGDLHLGQVLVVEDDFHIIDFEGEPARPFAERRMKSSPLKDIAGMRRSFNYAAWSALFPALAERPERVDQLKPQARRWEQLAADAFLRGYEKAIVGCSACPSDPGVFRRLLDLFLLEKALYEIRYELANRPGWLRIPLEGALALLRAED
jgi:maltose alpha-D-glucosyltransferase/alpha-amylase